jgi:putative Ig domain-containing protein
VGNDVLLAPRSGQLPVGSTATFTGRLATAHVIGQPGRRVTFSVDCGPNAGRTRSPTTDVRGEATFSYASNGRTGTDDLSVASKSAAGRTERATGSITWVPPVDCGHIDPGLGFLTALQCLAAKPLVRTIVQLGECTVAVATFFAPVAKLAKLLELADKFDSFKALAAAAGTGTPVAKFALDLYDDSRNGIQGFGQLKRLLVDAKSLAGFLRALPSLFGAIRAVDVNTIALDVANLTGLTPCVALLAKAVSQGAAARPPMTMPVTPTGPGKAAPTVSVTSPGNESGTVGSPVDVQIYASDTDGGALTYAAAALPTGVLIDATDGLITGTPTTAGSTTVTVTAADATGVTGSASFTWTIKAGGSSSPTLVATPSGAVNVGSSISDAATLDGGTGPTGTITFAAYSPDCGSAPTPPVFTATVPVLGDGTYSSGPFPAAAGGYFWTASYSGDANNRPTAAGVLCEPTAFVDVFPPTSMTISAVAAAPVGQTITDGATLTVAAATGPMFFTLFGPDDLSCAGEPLFISTDPVSASGTSSSGPFTTSAAGTYNWVASYGGDASNPAVSTACGDPGESVVVP